MIKSGTASNLYSIANMLKSFSSAPFFCMRNTNKLHLYCYTTVFTQDLANFSFVGVKDHNNHFCKSALNYDMAVQNLKLIANKCNSIVMITGRTKTKSILYRFTVQNNPFFPQKSYSFPIRPF